MALLFVAIHALCWPTLAAEYFKLVFENVWNLFLVAAYIDVQFLGVLIGVTLVHEGIHYVIARHYGFETEYGADWLGAYVLLLEQFINRWQYKRMVIAPLAIITVSALLGIVLPLGHHVSVLAKLVLLVNTSASSADMIDFLFYHRAPEHSQFYNRKDESNIHTYVYAPAS